MGIRKAIMAVFLLLPLLVQGFSRHGTNLEAHNSTQPPAFQIEQAKKDWDAGHFELAASQLKEALKSYEGPALKPERASCLMYLGIVLWDIGEIHESAGRFAEAARLFGELKDTPSENLCRTSLEIIRLYNLGKENRSRNRNRESLQSFDKAIDLGRQTGYEHFEVKCLRQESLTYWQLSDMEMFFACNTRALEIAKRINHRKEIGRCLTNIGAFYEKSSDYSNALRHLVVALPILQSENDLDTEAKCVNTIGIVYKKLGEFDKAIIAISRVLEIDKKAGDHLSILEDRTNLGATYLRRGWINDNIEDVKKAKDEFNDCFDLLRLNPYPKVEFALLTNLGFAYYLLHEYDQALNLFTEALKKTQKTRQLEEYANLLNNLANAYYSTNQIEKAIRYFSDSISLCENSEDLELLWEAYLGLGRCYEAKEEISAALASYYKSIEALEKIRRGISLDMFKISFARNKITVYQQALSILCSLYFESPSAARLEEIYKMMERAKANAFLESLIEARIRNDRAASPELMSSEMGLSYERATLDTNAVAPNMSESGRSERFAGSGMKKEEFMRLISYIKPTKRPNGDTLPAINVSLHDLQVDLLNEHTAVLEYFVGDDKSYVIVITANSVKLFRLPAKAELESSLRGYLKNLSSAPSESFYGILAAERIAHELISPLNQEELSEIQNLIIIPDGVLHYLPFETLRMHDGGRSIYLIEKYCVSYSPSSAVLFFLEKGPRRLEYARDLLAFGAPQYHESVAASGAQKITPGDMSNEDDLGKSLELSPIPFSKREVLRIARLFSKPQADVFLGRQASEATLKKLPLDDYRIIHFACHGILDDKLPFRSSLVLAPDDSGGEDGILQVRDIYGMKMDTELVVLSACQTGNGTLERGEGLIGMTRSIFHAGGRSVLSSIWAVDDRSTVDLMEDFYSGLVRGQDKSSALRRAKLKMLRSKHAHPFYWAGFVLSGDPAPIRVGTH